MKKLEDYMKIPYCIEMELIPQSEGGGILARIPLLKGCMSDGESYDEAAKNLEDAKREWFSYMLKNGYDIPEPTDEIYSGKFTLRVPKTLHKQLAERADKEGVSLNQLAMSLLSYQSGKEDLRIAEKRPITINNTTYNISTSEIDAVKNVWNKTKGDLSFMKNEQRTLEIVPERKQA